MPIFPRKTLLTLVAGAGWLASVAFGMGVLLNYESTPGGVAATPKSWPLMSKIRLAGDRPTLVMVAHPHCPCTKATVGELAKIMANAQGRVAAYVLFLKPSETAPDWDETPLRQSASEIPGVTVVSDTDGVEARRFGAETSGHTLLFAADGQLLFSGGITASRGHAGSNAGESAIASLLQSGRADRRETSVFGCALASRCAAAERAKCSE